MDEIRDARGVDLVGSTGSVDVNGGGFRELTRFGRGSTGGGFGLTWFGRGLTKQENGATWLRRGSTSRCEGLEAGGDSRRRANGRLERRVAGRWWDLAG